MRWLALLALTLLAPVSCKKTDDGAIAEDDTPKKSKKKPKKDDDAWSQGGPVPIESTDPQVGSRLAPVTLVVWTDLQCPFCKKFDATIEELRAQYGDKLRVVFHEFPLEFHKDAAAAAEAAQIVFLAKGSKAYREFTHKAFENSSSLTKENLEKWMADAGVDEVSADLRRRANERVLKDQKAGKKLGIVGTPHSFLDGHKLAGAQPASVVGALIEAHLKKGQELDVKPDKIYEELSKIFYTPSAKAEADDPDKVFKISVAGAPIDGPKDALVTIVTFGDYQCPFCKRLDDVLVLIRKDYPKQVRLVWKHEPLAFHARAVPAANFAIDAFKQKSHAGFWKVHRALFASLPSLADSDLETIGTAQGLDVPRAMAAVASSKWAAEIKSDHADGLLVGVSGTPCSFVNGRRVVGAQPYSKFKDVVEERLIEAEKLVKGGTDPDKVYDELMKTAK